MRKMQNSVLLYLSRVHKLVGRATLERKGLNNDVLNLITRIRILSENYLQYILAVVTFKRVLEKWLSG